MADKESYCLSSNMFESNIQTSWEQLLIEKDFCDVTLACNDGSIRTHRIVISHGSPVLKQILKQNPNINPVIYLRGIKYKYLENLINFMYQGEVSVNYEDLESFLDVAVDLKVTGLSLKNRERSISSEELSKTMDDIKPYNSNLKLGKIVDYEKVQQIPTRKSKIQQSIRLNSSNDDLTVIAVSPNFKNKTEIQNLEPEGNTELSHLTEDKHKTEKLFHVNDRQFQCNMCDKQYTSSYHLNQHKASAHEWARYSCDKCNAGPFSQASTLRIHKESAHKGVRYPCDQCDGRSFARVCELKKHRASAHEGVRYGCNICEYKATQAGHLRTHIASVHEGIRYPCDECNAGPFTQARYLETHKASAHEGIRYPCDQCNAGPFIRPSHLKRHKASAHEGIIYPCDQCDGRSFTRVSELKQHRASAHEGVRYGCNICEYKGIHKWNLRAHIKKVHNI